MNNVKSFPPKWDEFDANNCGVQADWNQNDETKPDYVKNRPFYTGDPVETVLVEESTVPFSFSESNGVYLAQHPTTFSATVGDTYKVSWDGTVYECVCENFNNIPVIGNISIAGVGSDTGEPFFINVNNGRRINIGTKDTAASHTFSISGFVTEVVKIDEKYLPSHIIEEIIIKATEVERGKWEIDKTTLPTSNLRIEDKDRIYFELEVYNSVGIKNLFKATSFDISGNNLRGAIGLGAMTGSGDVTIYKTVLSYSGDTRRYYAYVEEYALENITPTAT